MTVHISFIDINECSASPSVCDRNANCQNTKGSYLCSCNVGFTGDGKTCKGKKEVLDKGDVLVVVVVVVYVYVVVLSLFSIHELSQKCYCVLAFVKGEGVIAC